MKAPLPLIRTLIAFLNIFSLFSIAEGGAGYIHAPLYRYKVFAEANFFSGRWPLRECGLTSMDYNTVSCPEAEALVQSAIQVPVKEWMTEEYIELVAKAIRKVTTHYLR